MNCPNCGAANPVTATSCTYCGTQLARDGRGERADVFDRIRASRVFAESLTPQRHARLPKIQAVHKWLLGGFSALFIGGSLLMFVVAAGMAVAFGLFGSEMAGGRGVLFSLFPLCMGLVPLAFLIVGIFVVLALRKKMQTIETAPVESLPVIVVDKRTLVSGGGDRMTSTQYFVTCDTVDADRQEFQLWDGALYGKMAAGDQGVLFVRAAYGLDFDRVAD